MLGKVKVIFSHLTECEFPQTIMIRGESKFLYNITESHPMQHSHDMQGSTARGQGSTAMGQSSMARGQGSAARGQGSAARGQGSTARGRLIGLGLDSTSTSLVFISWYETEGFQSKMIFCQKTSV
jgi:hypothetical protein